ncbi:excisionase [Aquabacterium sp.]|uniref:excisionase n=1 Tax=Aquabacterium sp. TaxID=1872578 RepID=UPI0035C74D1E
MTTVAVAAARYVRIALAAAITGLSVEAIEQKIKGGVWLEGQQYVRKGREIYIDMRGFEKWVEQEMVGSS